MFDLITGELKHAPRHQATPMLVSVVVHAVIAGAILMVTLFMVSEPVPAVRTMMMMAFVAPPPPPPPPAPMPAVSPARTRAERAERLPSSSPAPVDVPTAVTPEPPTPDSDEEGMAAGVEGGLSGGTVGGVLGTLEIEAPPLPPPPPPAPRAPIRVGGNVKEPALIHRVDPIYPVLAVSAGVQGTVILEAIVDRDGCVESLRVLRSQGVLDRAALDAVKQWRYSPVLLNGQPERFILTVVVLFKLEDG